MAEKKRIQVVGAGCKKCKRLLENTQQAVNLINKENEYEIEYITDIDKFADLDVMITPALRIDGKIVSSGKMVQVEKIIEFLK